MLPILDSQISRFSKENQNQFQIRNCKRKLEKAWRLLKYNADCITAKHTDEEEKEKASKKSDVLHRELSGIQMLKNHLQQMVKKQAYKPSIMKNEMELLRIL